MEHFGSSSGLWVEGAIILPLWDIQDFFNLLVFHVKDTGEGVLRKNKGVFISAAPAPVSGSSAFWIS